jgi:hypothetical protein
LSRPFRTNQSYNPSIPFSPQATLLLSSWPSLITPRLSLPPLCILGPILLPFFPSHSS